MPTSILSGPVTGTNEESQDSAIKYAYPVIQNTPSPASLATGQTLTAQQVINGIVTVSNANTASTLTLPSAAAIAALLRTISSRGVFIGDTIFMDIVNGNTTAGNLTITPGSGLTFDANSSGVVAFASGRSLNIRFNSVTLGAETAVIY